MTLDDWNKRAKTLIPWETHTWASTGDTDYGNPDNWDKGHVPNELSPVVFDETSSVDCHLNGDRKLQGLAVQEGYKGTISGPQDTLYECGLPEFATGAGVLGCGVYEA